MLCTPMLSQVLYGGRLLFTHAHSLVQPGVQGPGPLNTTSLSVARSNGPTGGLRRPSTLQQSASALNKRRCFACSRPLLRYARPWTFGWRTRWRRLGTDLWYQNNASAGGACAWRGPWRRWSRSEWNKLPTAGGRRLFERRWLCVCCKQDGDGGGSTAPTPR